MAVIFCALICLLLKGNDATVFFMVKWEMKVTLTEFIIPFIDKLQRMSENDVNRVVRIHCLGAIKALKLFEKIE